MSKNVEKNSNTKIIIASGVLFGAGALAAATVIGLKSVASHMFKIAVVNDRESSKKKNEEHIDVNEALEGYKDEIEASREWKRSQPFETVYIRSFDKLRLAAEFLPAQGAKGTIIMVHGYRSSAERDFACIMRDYYERGYNLLLVHQRAHGLSEGKYITYGVKESRDVTDWARWVEGHLGENVDIFLDGVSMGATTVLMASGLHLPSNVRGIIADCGFTSAREIFKHVMKTKYHAPGFPVIGIADRISRKKAGFSFKECDTRKALARSRVPVLFVHGTSDEFVPVNMTIENYEACNAAKEILLIEEAGHALSYFVDKEEYLRALDEFFKKYGKC